MMKAKSLLYLVCTGILSCHAQETPKPSPPGSSNNATSSIGITGDTADVTVTTEPGIVLMGGSTDVDQALQWMIARAQGGDVVIIRASGSTGYNDYIYGLGRVNSVETLLIDSRAKALKTEAGDRIRQAEMLFIAGGDQWNYVNFWKDSEVSKAIRFLVEEKKIPIGGTSAGCAVLSGIIFDAKNGSAVSEEVLPDPYHQTVSLSKSFISLPFLENTISDQHYSQRMREGRHVTFMARMTKDMGISQPKGIGVDERTAVCIDKDGNASVFGSNKAYFLISNSTQPESCLANTPLRWDNHDNAVRAYIYQAGSTGVPAFNLATWPVTQPAETWYVENGILKRTVQ